VPPWGDEPGGHVRERGEDEQPLGGLGMWDDEEAPGLARVEGQPCGRPIKGQAGPAEHEQIEVELARPPALALLSTECPLELLQGDQQGRGTGRRLRAGGDVDRDDRVAERRLVGYADRGSDVQARDRVGPKAWEGGKGPHRPSDRRRRIVQVRSESDVRPDALQDMPPVVSRLRHVTDVAVLILHPEPANGAHDIEQWVAAARRSVAERHRAGFLAAGASDVALVSGPPDARTFGTRLRMFVASRRPAGLVVLGSGAMPLATTVDRRRFVEAAGSTRRVALANNRYSSDAIAVAGAGSLTAMPDLIADNALPRWLAEAAGYEVADLRRRWRLGFDIDGPLELILLGERTWLPKAPDGAVERVARRLDAVRAVARDAGRELIVTGRTSAAALAWLERTIPARTRVLVEERGLRTAIAGQRPPRSVLGAALDREGAGRLGSILAELGDAALVDSRVLLAHRIGADEAPWPVPADRFASDLLLHERIADGWLRDLTAAAADAPIPIVLGGHSLVGPGLRLALGGT
jgi:hypothetical protein